MCTSGPAAHNHPPSRLLWLIAGAGVQRLLDRGVLGALGLPSVSSLSFQLDLRHCPLLPEALPLKPNPRSLSELDAEIRKRCGWSSPTFPPNREAGQA